MHSQEPGGNYSAILKDLMARRAALSSAITKLQAPQAGSNAPSLRREAGTGNNTGSADAKGATAN